MLASGPYHKLIEKLIPARLQYVLLLLGYTPSRELVSFILDTIEGDLDTWTALDALPGLAESLLETHKRIKSYGSPDRRIVALLRQLARAGHLEATAAAAFEQECQDHASVSSTLTSLPVHRMTDFSIALPAVPVDAPASNARSPARLARVAIAHRRQLTSGDRTTLHDTLVPLPCF